MWVFGEERQRTHSEDSVEDGYTREMKKGRPKTRWKNACQRDMNISCLRAGEEMDRTASRFKIVEKKKKMQALWSVPLL